MPLSQRSPNAHERKPSTGTAGKNEPTLDTEEELRDALQRANTECNKANDAKDKLQSLYEQSSNKLSEIHKAKDDLKSELQAVKEHNAALKSDVQRFKDAIGALKYENMTLTEANEALRVKYENLLDAFNAIHPASPTNSTANPIPERPKARSSTKKEHREDRGRIKDKEREREREHRAAEKERLSQRFEGKRPPPSNRRESFIEPWGPGGRSGSVNPSTRAYTTVATGRIQAAAVTPSQQPAYSNIPRVSNPLSPGIYGNTASMYPDDDDDDDYEDGNYHAHPIPRSH